MSKKESKITVTYCLEKSYIDLIEKNIKKRETVFHKMNKTDYLKKLIYDDSLKLGIVKEENQNHG